ncbi:RNA-directed DNA methylation 4-like [Vicia villosa]|uniref:RNA-directed DNA methylation 4-like n=1 Tax=Vicia villosa TaxID=3911 RepID=UPI00273AAB35|nr:RNA-directed DNA methylation 4-like [Vicia villosa]
MRSLDRNNMTESSLSSLPRKLVVVMLNPLEINEKSLKRTLSDFRNLSISDSSPNGLETIERPFKRPLLDPKITVTDSSSVTGSPCKRVFVRVKRKPFQSPLDALWLEINKMPLKHPLLDFGNLSILNSSQNMELHKKLVLVQHVKTISSPEDTLDIVHSFLEPHSRSASESKSKVGKRNNFKKVNSSAIDDRFKQIRKTADENALLKICQFYDIVRVDSEEKVKEVQKEDVSSEDQRLLANFIPLLIDVIPKAAAEIEADISVHSKQGHYVYDLYTLTDERMEEEDSSNSYPLVQVEDEHFYDGPDDSDYETDHSDDVDTSGIDYPAKFSEEEGSECESEERKHDSSCNELLDENI